MPAQKYLFLYYCIILFQLSIFSSINLFTYTKLWLWLSTQLWQAGFWQRTWSCPSPWRRPVRECCAQSAKAICRQSRQRSSPVTMRLRWRARLKGQWWRRLDCWSCATARRASVTPRPRRSRSGCHPEALPAPQEAVSWIAEEHGGLKKLSVKKESDLSPRHSNWTNFNILNCVYEAEGSW